MDTLTGQAKLIIDFLRDQGVAIRQADSTAWMALGPALRACKINPLDVEVLSDLTVRKMLIGGQLTSAVPLHELLVQLAPHADVPEVRDAASALLAQLVAEHASGQLKHFMHPDAIHALGNYIRRFVDAYPEWEDDLMERPGQEPQVSVQLGIQLGKFMLEQSPCPGDPEAIRRCIDAASEHVRLHNWGFGPRSERQA